MMKHEGPIAGIAARGPYVATAGYDNRVILWQAAGKRAVARGLHDHLVNHCAFNSDGTLLASAGSDYTARIWEVPSLRLKAALVGHEDDVDMAVFSPDDRLVATCALDRSIGIFDLSGRCLNMLRGHTGNILSVAWSRDGRRLVSSSVDGTVRTWCAASGAEIACTDLGIRVDTLEIDGDGRILAGDDHGRIAIIRDGEISYTPAHRAGVKKLVFDEAAGILVSFSYDRTVAVWRLGADGDLRELARTDLPVQVWARAAALAGPCRVAVGTFGSGFGIFDWSTGTWEMEGTEPGSGLNAVAVMDGDRYQIGDAGVLFRNDRPATALGSLCNFLLPADGLLLSGGQLGHLFDALSGRSLYQHHSPLNCAATFRRAGRPHVVVGTYTGEALIFARSADGLELLTSLRLYENAIKGVVATEERIFTVCASTAIAWHDTVNFQPIRVVPRAHERIANGCCLAGADGFASIGRDRKLRLWMADGDEVYQTPHPNSVKCICASTDRNTLMTGAYTGTLASFDVPTRSWRSFERPTAAGISALAYDDGRGRFLASSYDGRVYAAG